jgi:hypothetical protein
VKLSMLDLLRAMLEEIKSFPNVGPNECSFPTTLSLNETNPSYTL